MSEDQFIESCKRTNPHLFAAASIVIKPSGLEALARRAFQEGQKSVDVVGAYSGVVDQIRQAFKNKGK
jgi:hypothetical protein